MKNGELWENLNKEKRHQTIYPVESVIRFVKKNFKKGSRILDDGCGAGRHIIFLANEGYIAYGIDITQSGADYTRNRLESENYEGLIDNIHVGSCDELPFENNFFDGVISYGVLYYMNKTQIENAIKEMYRVLKQGGKALLNIRTLEDYRFNKTTVVDYDDHGCIIDEVDNAKSSKKETGMFMHFFDKNEVRELCREFSNVEINTEICYHENDSYADVNFLVEMEK